MSETRTHTFSTGVTVTLNPINPMVIQSFQLEGRPKRPPIPMDISTVNGETVLTPNPDHPAYIAAIKDFTRREQEYQAEQLLVAMRYAFVNGIANDPDDKWVKQHKRFMYDDHQLKYSWVFAQLEDMEDAVNVLNIIVGQTEATEQGIVEAEGRFPALGSGGENGNAGERVSDEGDESGSGGDASADGGT